MVRNIIIITISVILAFLASINALTAITKRKQAETSLNMPIFFNGIAAETAAANSVREIIANNGNKIPQQLPENIINLALKSFQSEPTTSSSIAILAIAQDSKKKRMLMKQAHQFSKRDQLVIGWLVNDAVENNNLESLLTYYDTSMRASYSAQNIILPLMVNALTNDLSIKPLYNILDSKPIWTKKFWNLASVNKDSIKNTANLRSQLYKKDENNSLYNDTALIRTLVANYNYQEAIILWSYLNQISPEYKLANKQAVSDNNFKTQATLPPIDWQIYANGEYGASVTNNGLILGAVPNSGGLFARQLIYLQPQLYQVKIDMGHNLPSKHSIKIELACAENIDNKPSIIAIPISNKTTSRRLSNQEDVCRHYWLNIRGRASDTDGLDANIKSISILQNQQT